MTTSSIISNVSLSAEKGTLYLIPCVSFAVAYQPSDSFTCDVPVCVGFKGHLTYIQTGK